MYYIIIGIFIEWWKTSEIIIVWMFTGLDSFKSPWHFLNQTQDIPTKNVMRFAVFSALFWDEFIKKSEFGRNFSLFSEQMAHNISSISVFFFHLVTFKTVKKQYFELSIKLVRLIKTYRIILSKMRIIYDNDHLNSILTRCELKTI